MTLPSAIAYMMIDGKLVSTPRGHGYGGDVSLPGDYALVYFETIGKHPSRNRMAKVFVTKGSNNHEIKEFYLSQYSYNSELFKKSIESYIKDQLSVPQTVTYVSRKKSITKSKTKRKCRCKK